MRRTLWLVCLLQTGCRNDPLCSLRSASQSLSRTPQGDQHCTRVLAHWAVISSYGVGPPWQKVRGSRSSQKSGKPCCRASPSKSVRRLLPCQGLWVLIALSPVHLYLSMRVPGMTMFCRRSILCIPVTPSCGSSGPLGPRCDNIEFLFVDKIVSSKY